MPVSTSGVRVHLENKDYKRKQKQKEASKILSKSNKIL